jgi:hypothetical protein
LEARLGDAASARSRAAALERAGGSPGAGGLAQRLAAGVRARIAWEAARPAEAVRELEGMAPGETAMDILSIVPFHAHGAERWLRAEALRALGRREEAAGWYLSFAEHSPYGRVFRGPAAARLAAMGRRVRW